MISLLHQVLRLLAHVPGTPTLAGAIWAVTDVQLVRL